jgi:hypothetical protein
LLVGVPPDAPPPLSSDGLLRTDGLAVPEVSPLLAPPEGACSVPPEVIGLILFLPAPVTPPPPFGPLSAETPTQSSEPLVLPPQRYSQLLVPQRLLQPVAPPGCAPYEPPQTSMTCCLVSVVAPACGASKPAAARNTTKRTDLRINASLNGSAVYAVMIVIIALRPKRVEACCDRREGGLKQRPIRILAKRVLA